MHRTANPATPVRTPGEASNGRPDATEVGVRKQIFLAAIALSCAAPAAAFEHSVAISLLERDLVYGGVSDPYALMAKINESAAARAKGDPWDKFILGLQYKALASWHDQGVDGSAAAAPSPERGAPVGGLLDGSPAKPPGHKYRLPQTGSEVFQVAPQAAVDYAQQAVVWLKAAAADGLAAAPDVGRAGELTYRRAGALAANALGEIYAFGLEGRLRSKGIAPDFIEAYVWFSVAAAENEAGAAQNLAEVSVLLPGVALQEAKSRLRALKPQLAN